MENPQNVSPEIIIQKFENVIKSSGSNYENWKIGTRNFNLIAALALSIEIYFNFCTSQDADKVLKYFLDKNLTKDKLSQSNSNGIFIYR